MEVRLTPDTEGDWDHGGCTATLRLAYQPRGLGGLVASLMVRHGELGRLAGTYAAFDAALAAGRDPEEILGLPAAVSGAPGGPRAADPATRARIDRGLAQAAERHPSPHWPRLGEALSTEDPVQLFRMRPYRYARLWDAERREVLELFLAATEAGLVTMRWDVLCPHCRGDRANLERLDAVRESAYCSACDLHFDVDLSRNVEAVFAPHPGIRAVETARFCLGGPGSNPHVFFQHRLEAGEHHQAPWRLPPGRYRLRDSASDRFRWVDVADDGAADPLSLRLGEVGDDLALAADAPVPVTLENAGDAPVLVTLETTEWIQDTLSAGELVATQHFRDLFSTEALAPGVKLAVERTTILFTDVVGSTALYRRIGDARAFRLVWTHFDGLREVIAEEGGALVKTIGDAVMAVFPRADQAIKAAARLQAAVDRTVAALGVDDRIPVKIGVADGPCIAVNLDGRLDYFGTTVNLAARVQARSRGEDILVARDTAERAGYGALLEAEGWSAEPLEVEAKGFEAPVSVLRFTRRASTTTAAG